VLNVSARARRKCGERKVCWEFWEDDVLDGLKGDELVDGERGDGEMGVRFSLGLGRLEGVVGRRGLSLLRFLIPVLESLIMASWVVLGGIWSFWVDVVFVGLGGEFCWRRAVLDVVIDEDSRGKSSWGGELGTWGFVVELLLWFSMLGLSF
jgi:hypothetical protein